MYKVMLLTSYMSGNGGVEKVIERMYSLEKDLSSKFYTISLTDGIYMDENGITFSPVKCKNWIPKGRGRYLRVNLKSKPLNLLLHILYVLIFIFLNKFDVIIATGPIQSLYLKIIKKITLKKFQIIGWPHFSATSGYGDFNKFKYADNVLCISRGIKQQLNDIGISDEKLFYFPNPFPETSLITAEKLQNVKTFIFIGRFQFEGQKNLKELIDAASLLIGDYKIILIGDGEDYEKIKKYIHTKSLSKYFNIQKGWRENPWKDLQCTPMALILTSTFEGLPTVLGEALSRGVPCISSSCPTGPDDFIVNGVNGFLYPSGCPEKLASIIQSFIDGENFFIPEQIQKSLKDLYIPSYKKRYIKFMENL
ncbi:glycosyltransferase [Pluralibacter gergoviae]|nr:glycosyltransferase [Pluralibacter gergoviae]ELD4275038.1 glycosyltransferase [Pluralibacter gergoviae]ELD4316332.1 glycosyltransferase [Pluralibacter gergoviae]ELD4341048.1 glycosyltransferase [Pluralibacter gergoviae]